MIWAFRLFPAAVLVLRKHKADDRVLFIDASRDFEAGKNQNVLREAACEAAAVPIEFYRTQTATPALKAA